MEEQCCRQLWIQLSYDIMSLGDYKCHSTIHSHEKDGLALTDATTNANRFEPSVPTVAPTTVGKKGLEEAEPFTRNKDVFW